MRLFGVVVFLFKTWHVYCRVLLYISPFNADASIEWEENRDLNLTCRVISNRRLQRHNLTWRLPSGGRRSDRVTVYESADSLTLTIHGVREGDQGEYECTMKEQGSLWSKKVTLLVRSSAEKCSSSFFHCGGDICIGRHYVCDGYVDCPSGLDETFKLCGVDACRDKIQCEGRCIRKELCCDPHLSANCSVGYLMPCCLESTLVHRSGGTAPSDCPPLGDCQQWGSGGGYPVLYAVATAMCAVVAALLLAAVVLLAGRYRHYRQLRRWWSRIPASELVAGARLFPVAPTCPGLPRRLTRIENQDTDSTDVSDDAMGGHADQQNLILVDFIPGLGFQVAECGPKPPPYTENPPGIPPPPYESRTNLSAPDTQVQ